MKKIVKCFLVLLLTILLLPYNVQATNANVLEEQLKQETNQIMNLLEEQKNDSQAMNSLIVGLFVVVIISMIFESIVRGFKMAIKEKNENNATDEEITSFKKKLWTVYGIHIIVLIIMFFTFKYAIKMINLYNIFFLFVSICMVEIGPFLQIRMKKKKRRNNDTTH